MAYLGREPAYGSFDKQSLTADGSTTTFYFNLYGWFFHLQLWFQSLVFFKSLKLPHNISEGGTKIVFTAAPESGDTVFVVFLDSI